MGHVIKQIFMKAIKVITNSYTLIISFLIIIISGQHLGGFYIIYLLIALPYFGIHSILALVGIILLLIIYHNKKNRCFIIRPLINLVSVLMLIASIYMFFYNDKEHYNYGTFYQLVPQITLIVFSFIALSFIVRNIVSVFKSSKTIINTNQG